MSMWNVIRLLAVATFIALVVHGCYRLSILPAPEATIVTLPDSLVVITPPAIRIVPRKPPEVAPLTPTNRALKTPTAKKPAGWTLPYSCETVRTYAHTFSAATLEKMRVAAGASLPTPDQKRQIEACIKGTG